MQEWIKSVIENPILLSIITGIITFVITWPINNWLTKKTSKKEYYDKLDECNKQIIQLCEDYVLLSPSFEDKIFERIIKGVCDENKVNIDDAYSIQSVKAILVKNFVNMRFVAIDDKIVILRNLCLVDINSNDKMESKEVVEKVVHVEVSAEKGIKFATAAMSATVSTVAFIASLLSISERENNFLSDIYKSFSTSDNHLIYIILFMLIVLIVEMVLFIVLTLKKKNKKSGDDIDRDNKDSKYTDIIKPDR